MKMEIKLEAPCDGVVLSLQRQAGAQVAAGERLLVLEVQ
jgi:biotin carboxyl carrier protein